MNIQKKEINRIIIIGANGMFGGASLTLEQANQEISESHVDLVTWDRSILANVDFFSKLKSNEELLSMTNEIRNELF